jgi:ribosome-associated protein
MIEHSEKTILNVIAQTIFDKKGFNILALDVRGISTMTDFFLIAEGSVDRHVKALSMAIQEQLDAMHVPLYRIEGEKDGDWIVMDYSDIVIHLFIQELREKYALEELWKKAKIVDLDIIVPNSRLKESRE